MKKTLMITLLLAGCGNVPMLPSLQPYKIEIQQGNYVTQDMVAKLKPGMTRSQVRSFRTDRWDYVYMLHKQGNLVEQRQVTVVFKGEVLDRIEGDVVAGTAAPAGAKTAAPVVKPEAQEKK